MDKVYQIKKLRFKKKKNNLTRAIQVASHLMTILGKATKVFSNWTRVQITYGRVK